MNLHGFIQTFYKLLIIGRRLSVKRSFVRYFSRIIDLNNLHDNINRQSFNQWTKKWGVFGSNPIPHSFQAYYKYINGNVNTVPNDIARNYIEPILTPEEYQPFYNDKNSFGLIIPQELMPRTLFRSINGLLYDGDYNPISKESFQQIFGLEKHIIVKPSKDMGGRGVTLFSRRDDTNDYYDTENNKLTLEFLLSKYERNFLIQECMRQSSYMRQFNPTSVNTIRIATYRDIQTGEIHILGAVLRIGGKGAFIDNACSGGAFVSVDEHGRLGKYVCTKYGQTAAVYNDIDFSKSSFVIPDYERVKEFSKSIAKRLPHMSLFANDIAIDENGNPKLIEVNTTEFSYWLYQLNGVPVFGEFTDSVIDYTKKQQSRLATKLIQMYF